MLVIATFKRWKFRFGTYPDMSSDLKNGNHNNLKKVH